MRYKKDNKDEFRIPDTAYWDYLFCISGTRKQISPIMVFPGGKYKSFYYTQKLYEESINKGYPEDTLILHAWPGEWRTDIFAYSVEEYKKQFVKTI